MNMAKRPVPKYDFKAFGAAIKAARTGRKESRKKVNDEMYISPRYLANIENNGQHPSLQIFFELMLRYNISVDQFLLDKPAEKNTQRRQLDALLDGISDTGLRIVTATAKEDVYKRQVYDRTADAVIEYVGDREQIIELLRHFHYESANVPQTVIKLSLIHICNFIFLSKR